jgi:uncharacterized protein YjcR
MAAKYSDEIVEKARREYLLGTSIADIVDLCGLNSVRVVYTWREKYEWDKQLKPESALLRSTREFNRLIDIQDKTPQNWQEIERLKVIIIDFEDAELARELKREQTFSRSETKEKNQRKKRKNDVSECTQEKFDWFAENRLYKHQKIIYDAGKNPETRRSRFILKPRQVGGSFGLAFEAFESAAMEGQNQIFLSATVAQAEVFKSYMAIIALKYFDVELAGNPCILSNKAEIFFLSPQAFSAQSRSGNYYLDEVFWLRGDFKTIFEVSSKMATQSRFKRTLISTPSAVSHPAYPYWSGEWFNKNRPPEQKVEIDISDMATLKQGKKFGDGWWRYAFTVQDVVEWGFNDFETGEPMISIEELRLETDPLMFPCLFECQFIDDSASVFKLSDILACAVDTAIWVDYDKFADRPYGSKPVTVGYDVAGVGDNASAIVLSKPVDRKDKFRLLQKNNWRGVKAPAQCERMEYVLSSFNVETLGVDITGSGYYIGDYLEPIFPMVEKVQFSPEVKTAIVQKFQSVLQEKRFEYDEDDINFPLACMTVYQTVTEKSNQITYASNRTKATGHADEFWATGLAIYKAEPFFNINFRSSFSFDVYN